MDYLLLLVGFGLLIAGANYFVEGSSNIATLLKVPPMIIGLTIVAFGTGSPEATVSIIAALNGSAGVSVGNVIGSNVFNTTLVIGMTAIILAVQVEKETLRKQIPFTLLASVALLVLVGDVQLQGDAFGVLTRGDGVVLLLFFGIFLYYLFEVAREGRAEGSVAERAADSGQEGSRKEAVTSGTKGRSSWSKNILFTVAGLAAIIYGGHLVVQKSTNIALAWGMSETLVGLTIVSIGTSLPELVTSITAALKKQNDIAVGNIIGSNIFNILFVLGVSAVIFPLQVESGLMIDILIVIALTVLLFIVSRTQYRVGRIEGSLLVLSYIVYMVYVVIRG
ncbi:calcium/sodium antiporter [Paenibacillus sp. J5C_2022]|uniref:calcium/sodium antiporter n=1 Tax=Paenibacillus sp. J5C2022 TaxID=2977129 RepID=UPI0021CF0AC7|nr:calcium/sodium antiporter [Paenibacillus sp. J5C2022]MCU6708678.1 calcium/sodium antiporter [Paenibacillus sp. J5C2022]